MAIQKPLPVTFRSKAINGKLPGIDKELFTYLLNQVEGKEIELTLNYYVRKRSTAQNAYYWPVVVEYVLEGLIDTGYRRDQLTPDIVHEYLKNKFLKHMKRRVVNPGTKKYITLQPTTQTLTTWEFMDYMEAIIIWAAEFLSISIPVPDKRWKEEAERQYNEALSKNLITADERNRVRIALKLAAVK